MINISKIFSTFFYIGFFRWAPGTFGSLIFIFLIYFLFKIFSLIEFIIIFMILILISIKLVQVYSDYIKKNDAKEIIIDEFLGLYIIMVFFDYYPIDNDYFKLSLIFILFRFFDIIKPFPAGWIDQNVKNSKVDKF